MSINELETKLSELSEAERIVYTESLCAVLENGDVAEMDWGYYPGEGELVLHWDKISDMLFASFEQKLKAYNITKGIK